MASPRQADIRAGALGLAGTTSPPEDHEALRPTAPVRFSSRLSVILRCTKSSWPSWACRSPTRRLRLIPRIGTQTSRGSIGARACCLTHSATLFTIFEADVTASGLRDTGQLVTGLIGRELRREGLQAGTFGDLERQEVLLAKTADRSVLGCMNDMAFLCEHAIAGAGVLARTGLAELNRSLRRNTNSARGYRPPSS